MEWTNLLKSLQKNSLMSNIASHNNPSWYTDADGFLEYSLSRDGEPVLQEARPPEYNSSLLGESPLIFLILLLNVLLSHLTVQ